jgi:hypothetical protein
LFKRIVFTLLEFIVFCVLLIVGGYWDFVRLIIQMRAPALNIIPLLRIHNITATHDWVANGFVFALVFLLLLLAAQAWRRTIGNSGPLTLLAFLVAVVLSLAFKLGLPPANP